MGAASSSVVHTTVAGVTVVAQYGDTADEYAALRTAAIVIDRSHRSRAIVTGLKAAETIGGLVTNDVAALAAGHGLYAAALTPKGKIIADVRMFLRADSSLLIDTSARAAAGWMATMRKYINPRLAAHHDATGSIADIGVFGAHAAAVLGAATDAAGEDLRALPPYSQHVANSVAGPVLIARSPDIGLEGFDCFLPTENAPDLWRAIADAGARPAGLNAWEIARVEAGRPEWGLDMDDTTLAQEANLDTLHAISYTKGCYTGQETVARLHFRGHVNRYLRGLKFEGATPEIHTALFTDDKPVGEIGSAAQSPRLGGIALAMLRREVPDDAIVTARWEGGECTAHVTTLPFPH